MRQAFVNELESRRPGQVRAKVSSNHRDNFFGVTIVHVYCSSLLMYETYSIRRSLFVPHVSPSCNLKKNFANSLRYFNEIFKIRQNTQIDWTEFIGLYLQEN